MKKLIKEKLLNSKLIFWDFDGVIKNSLEVKEKAFISLFEAKSKHEKIKIANYHKNNGGFSRELKIRYFYKNIFKQSLKSSELKSLCLKFSEIVENQVVECKWVPGVFDFLKLKKPDQSFFLLSGTPHNEMVRITKKLGIYHFFENIYGHPHDKSDKVREILDKKKIGANEAFFIGDAMTDYLAAKKNMVPFVLKKNRYNQNLQKLKEINFMLINFL